MNGCNNEAMTAWFHNCGADYFSEQGSDLTIHFRTEQAAAKARDDLSKIFTHDCRKDLICIAVDNQQFVLGFATTLGARHFRTMGMFKYEMIDEKPSKPTEVRLKFDGGSLSYLDKLKFFFGENKVKQILDKKAGAVGL